ncbi:hypothetical protein HMSSN139_66140 [Paenibacillus sp. HMSSN-139]|nr:hypothetical protein HMSSN139_66140 [Paenibacillus sp. HMSSN-139]
MNSEDSGIILLGCTHCVIQGNVSSDDQEVHTQKFGIRLLDDGAIKSGKNIIVGNNVSGNTLAQIQLAGSLGTDVAYNNIGYNPIGYLPTPVVPATQTPMTNVYGSPVDVYVYGGTVMEIYKNGMLITGMTSGKLTLYPGETISLTYSAAPSWTWFGL